tara:strand:- start:6765 stop:6878 length:114 start_codon:yes stop_codon:yes gene_type:complete
MSDKEINIENDHMIDQNMETVKDPIQEPMISNIEIPE